MLKTRRNAVDKNFKSGDYGVLEIKLGDHKFFKNLAFLENILQYPRNLYLNLNIYLKLY